jgi:hypothetical protein
MDYFYSTHEALGVMAANGNLGTKLDRMIFRVFFNVYWRLIHGLAASGQNFYVSLNGGSDWKEVRNGAYVPEIGDHGSVIVAAKRKELTNEFMYYLGLFIF